MLQCRHCKRSGTTKDSMIDQDITSCIFTLQKGCGHKGQDKNKGDSVLDMQANDDKSWM